MLGPLLNSKSDLSVRNGVLLFKQLIRPMMNYACPAWRSANRAHVRRLQVLQSKCLRLATGGSWYVINRQIHVVLGVPLFADHIRALTWGTPNYGNSADTCADRGLIPSPDAIAKVGLGQQVSRGHRPRWPGRLNESRSAPVSRVSFAYPDRCFSVIFVSCKGNSRVYDAKSGQGPHFSPPGVVASPERLIKSHTSMFVTMPVWAQNPDSQPTKVYPSHN